MEFDEVLIETSSIVFLSTNLISFYQPNLLEVSRRLVQCFGGSVNSCGPFLPRKFVLWITSPACSQQMKNKWVDALAFVR